ncbi:hypothetical protein RTBOTA2_002486 [Rhodotorula toruloides]|nr:hypothetical protein RTBOTA2_002486 [Rhodotorula toruloides]
MSGRRPRLSLRPHRPATSGSRGMDGRAKGTADARRTCRTRWYCSNASGGVIPRRPSPRRLQTRRRSFPPTRHSPFPSSLCPPSSSRCGPSPRRPPPPRTPPRHPRPFPRSTRR